MGLLRLNESVVRYEQSGVNKDEYQSWVDQVQHDVHQFKMVLSRLNESIVQFEQHNVDKEEYRSWEHREQHEIHDVKQRLQTMQNASRNDFLCVLCQSCGGVYPIAV